MKRPSSTPRIPLARKTLLALAVAGLAATLAAPVRAQSATRENPRRDRSTIATRGDIRILPEALKTRLLDVAARPHNFLPITAFAEADGASQLFQYYLLDTEGFQPNVFTSIVPGINDNGVIKTGANFANGELPTIGAVRVVLEPKPGLPTGPDDPGAFIDMFTDVSGLFVINNESGWYEGLMIHDLRVPPVAEPHSDGRARYGTMTPADAAVLAVMGSGNKG